LTQPGSPADGAAFRGPPGTIDVFLSHVEEDGGVALRLVEALDRAGFTTWTSERDTIPGPPYREQAEQALDRSRAVIVLVSASSLDSQQMTLEITRARDRSKPLVPVLVGISHHELAARQPAWHAAMESAASMSLPAGAVDEAVPRIVAGLRAVGVQPTGIPGQPGAASWPPPPPARRSLYSRFAATPWWVQLALAGLVLLVVGGLGVAGTVAVVVSLDSDGASDSSTTSPTQPGAPPTTAAPADPGTTPLQTDVGEVRIVSSVLSEEFCPPEDFPGTCRKPDQGLFLIVTLEAWSEATTLTIDITGELYASYVVVDSQRHPPAVFADETGGVVRIVYTGLPAGAEGQDGTLHWPDNEPFRIRVTR
jgi:hypothetical protein